MTNKTSGDVIIIRTNRLWKVNKNFLKSIANLFNKLLSNYQELCRELAHTEKWLFISLASDIHIQTIKGVRNTVKPTTSDA